MAMKIPEFEQKVSLRLIDGAMRRTIFIDRFPFMMGRSSESNLVLPHSYISRNHATLTCEDGQIVLTDVHSSHGTFVNGQRITQQTLHPKDIIHLGSLDGPQLEFEVGTRQSSTNLTILAQMQRIDAHQSDLEKLRWLLQAARDLNSGGGVERVLASLLESTLALAKVERGYVFLMDGGGSLQLSLGMDSSGQPLTDTSSISQTVMRQAIEGEDRFLVTDTLSAQGEVPQSILLHNVRKIICIPLRRLRKTQQNEKRDDPDSRVFGVLYLESKFQSESSSDVDGELMKTIAREAAALIDNAQLAAIEDQERQNREELQIAASIQQGLMATQIPAFSFAEVQAHSAACSAVGGDFFDVISVDAVLSAALVDVSGKGISAAILASTLQGMLYAQLQTGQPLEAIASAINKYLCHKNVGKYATMLLIRLHPNGLLEYINCGHIQPRLCSHRGVSRLEAANLPVGLLGDAEYTAGASQLSPGQSVILVSDGFTEAENRKGEFFGEERLDSAAICSNMLEVIQNMTDFCAGHPANDDRTILQVMYRGQEAPHPALQM